jgi:hypothetical protein
MTPPPAVEPSESFDSLPPLTQFPRADDRPLPHSLDVEAAILGCCLVDGQETTDLCIVRGITALSFFHKPHATLWRKFQDLRSRGQPVDIALVLQDFSNPAPADIVALLNQISANAATTRSAPTLVDRLLEYERRRQVIEGAETLIEDAYDSKTPVAEFATAAVNTLSAIEESSRRTLRDRYTARAFRQEPAPEPAEPRIFIAGKPVCTPGNITNIIAQAKAGKTAYLGALIAAALAADASREDRDTLGITAKAPGLRALIHIDTEQSVYDHDQLIRVALRRAGVDTAPDWLQSYALAGFDAPDLRLVFRELLVRAHRKGGVYAVILDGAADFVRDVNAPEECNPFVAELHGLAIEHDCPIITVVHENPGQDAGKMRGHLGSQLERKAESNLRLRKNDEITTVFSEKMRRAPILEKDGPRFKWAPQDMMHMSCGSAGTSKDEVKRDKLLDLATAVFEHAGKRSLRYAEFLRIMAELRKISPSYAEDKFTEMKKLGVLRKDVIGSWSIPE